ncbi:MAG: hypothetical protein S4CHLAM20_13570 [Chlamydiia bacterium]|nr:hypothetical protein [Chlamydiia bacterium]
MYGVRGGSDSDIETGQSYCKVQKTPKVSICCDCFRITYFAIAIIAVICVEVYVWYRFYQSKNYGPHAV